MSSQENRKSIIETNYTSALESEPNDLAAADTPEQVAAIQANVANAKLVYYTAIASQLDGAGPEIEAAYQQVQLALQAVKDAREAAGKIADILQKLTGATDAAKKLVDKIKTQT